MSKEDFEITYDELNLSLTNDGFECHPFNVNWYNEKAKTFSLPYNEDTLAFVIISTPDMFEKTFVPFIKRKQFSGVQDPIDECMKQYFSVIAMKYSHFGAEIIHDFEILPNRKPRALLQTAAHVSGAAYFYQKCDVQDGVWNNTQKIYGVCVHPKYGGWFAIRAIIVFKEFTFAKLEQKFPLDIIKTEEQRVKLLELYNYSWQDANFRDIIKPEKRYSELQKKYFATIPKERIKLLEEIAI